MMINETHIGCEVLLAGSEEPVVITHIDGDNVAVYDESMPNPCGIPGLNNYWVHRSDILEVV